MKKRTFLLALVLTALVFVGYAVAAGGDASDPLVSLDFLNSTFRRQAEERIDEAVTKADAGALDDAKARWNAAVAAAEAAVGSDYAAVFTETRVKQDDILSGVTGLQVIPLAGELTVSFSAGTVVDVTDGRELTSGSTIPINHRCLVAEDTTALFTCTSKTAVLSYCGSYHFAPSGKPDRNAMAEALQSLSLFRGTGSGIGSGYELEKTPTRAEALIMLIRMLGEEKAALACTASQPFIDVRIGAPPTSPTPTKGATATAWERTVSAIPISARSRRPPPPCMWSSCSARSATAPPPPPIFPMRSTAP